MEELKQEAGKISNVDLKKSIVRVFYYLCVVSTYFLVLFIVKQHLNQAFSAACDFPIPDFWFQNWNFGDLGIHWHEFFYKNEILAKTLPFSGI